MEAGREADFHAFVITRSAALFRTAYLLTGDRHAAEDLVQSALAKTASRLRGLRDPAALEGYVRRSMYHEQASRWRRRSRGVEVATDRLPEQLHQGHADAADLRLVMRAALARLTPRQRTVLVLRYFEDLSETEIARGIDGGIYQAPLSGSKPRFVSGTKARHLLQWPWAGITTRRADEPRSKPDFQHLVNVLTGERRDAVVKQGEHAWGCSLTWCLAGLNVRHRDGSRVRALPGGMDWILTRTPALDRFVVLRQATGDDEARLVLYDLPTGRKGDLGAHLKKLGKDTAAMMNDTLIDYNTGYLLAYHLNGKQVIVDLTAIK